MIKVAGIWEDGWNTPITEFDLWAFPLADFEVDEWGMSPISGINKRVIERANIQDFVDENPGLTPIYVDENGVTDLVEFQHPENALYILGKAGTSAWKSSGQKELSVKIKTKKNKGLLWAHQAISIVLYDRLLKSWQ